MEYNLKKLVASMWEHRNNKDFENADKMRAILIDRKVI